MTIVVVNFAPGAAVNDSLNGGAGDDTLVGGAGTDTYQVVAGLDTISFADVSAAVVFSLASTASQRTGGAGNEAQLRWGEAVRGKVTVKMFLESGQKKSGAMKDIEAEYAYNKDNNKLGNFSTSVSDRSRPLNDQVSEKTTRLNDVSSRYNAAIEALNRFIQKYDSIMRDILGAI